MYLNHGIIGLFLYLLSLTAYYILIPITTIIIFTFIFPFLKLLLRFKYNYIPVTDKNINSQLSLRIKKFVHMLSAAIGIKVPEIYFNGKDYNVRVLGKNKNKAILLVPGFVNKHETFFTDKELESLLYHELSHVKRKDILFYLFSEQSFLKVIKYYFIINVASAILILILQADHNLNLFYHIKTSIFGPSADLYNQYTFWHKYNMMSLNKYSMTMVKQILLMLLKNNMPTIILAMLYLLIFKFFKYLLTKQKLFREIIANKDVQIYQNTNTFWKNASAKLAMLRIWTFDKCEWRNH